MGTIKRILFSLVFIFFLPSVLIAAGQVLGVQGKHRQDKKHAHRQNIR